MFIFFYFLGKGEGMLGDASVPYLDHYSSYLAAQKKAS